MTTFDAEILKALRHAWHALILANVNGPVEHDLVQRAARNADRQAASGTAEWYALALNSYAALNPRPARHNTGQVAGVVSGGMTQYNERVEGDAVVNVTQRHPLHEPYTEYDAEQD